jgi:predicted secreted hydrolase
MFMTRREWMAATLALPQARLGHAAEHAIEHLAEGAASVPSGVHPRPLVFPADHGAHPETRVEWWYVTGWLRREERSSAAVRPDFGFQVTFFRTRTGVAESSTSRFAARQLVFAHVALTDLASRPGAVFAHDQRIAREGFGIATLPGAADAPQVVRVGDWFFTREAAAGAGTSTRARIGVRSERFALDLSLRGTQPVLLQGDAGFSRKGPLPEQASHYYSEPQLEVAGRLARPGQSEQSVVGRAWLDHEWSDEYLAPEAVGWDWIGFNLFDGSDLMAFRLRRRDGSTLWAGGSWRDPAGRLRVFGLDDVRFTPGRTWTSPRTQVRYPVEWTLATPAGRHVVAALADDQELDSRGSTGAVYWEGVSALRNEAGTTLGWGYLELTGYGDRLRM